MILGRYRVYDAPMRMTDCKCEGDGKSTIVAKVGDAPPREADQRTVRLQAGLRKLNETWAALFRRAS